MEFGQILWSLLIIFFMVMYFMILFSVIIDIFRRHDMGGGMKAVWIILLLFIPFLSLIIYVIIYGQAMGQRRAAAVEQSLEDQQQYIRSVAKSASPAEQIAEAQRLLDAGSITREEFDRLKAKALA
jgi:type VI protein secretion system component VasK